MIDFKIRCKDTIIWFYFPNFLVSFFLILCKKCLFIVTVGFNGTTESFNGITEDFNGITESFNITTDSFNKITK